MAYLHTKYNQFYARVELSSTFVGVSHRQAIHQGSKCPDGTSDTNKDGVVDFKEAVSAAGMILIPLDSDVSSQVLGNEYPVIKEDGLYEYSEAAPLDLLVEELREEDLYPQDSLGKLSKNEKLDLENRTVIIYGIPETKLVPRSVTSNEGEPQDQWIPIACGRINRGKELEFLF